MNRFLLLLLSLVPQFSNGQTVQPPFSPYFEYESCYDYTGAWEDDWINLNNVYLERNTLVTMSQFGCDTSETGGIHFLDRIHFYLELNDEVVPGCGGTTIQTGFGLPGGEWKKHDHRIRFETKLPDPVNPANPPLDVYSVWWIDGQPGPAASQKEIHLAKLYYTHPSHGDYWPYGEYTSQSIQGDIVYEVGQNLWWDYVDPSIGPILNPHFNFPYWKLKVVDLHTLDSDNPGKIWVQVFSQKIKGVTSSSGVWTISEY